MELSSHHGQEIGTFVIFLIFLKTPQRPSLPNIQNQHLSIVTSEACGVQEIERMWEKFYFDNLRSRKVWNLWGRSEIYIVSSQILDSLKCSQPYCKILLCSMFNEQTCSRFTRLFVRLFGRSSMPKISLKPL